MHEYTVTDHPRNTILFWLAIISTSLSGVITQYINNWGFITVPVTSVTIFGLLYWLFNTVLWKLNVFKKIFKFPNVEGEWECNGSSTNVELQKDFNWEGTIVIKQSWNKVLITLKTKNSTSKSLSVTGRIKYYPGDGYKLSYHYENTPNPGSDKDMRKHEGFCVLTFQEDVEAAEGYYFNNNQDRKSYGEMYLVRRNSNGKKELSKKTRIA